MSHLDPEYIAAVRSREKPFSTLTCARADCTTPVDVYVITPSSGVSIGAHCTEHGGDVLIVMDPIEQWQRHGTDTARSTDFKGHTYA